MNHAKSRLVRAWLAKSEEDLSVASLLILTEKRLYAAGVYHCQQAAEKVLKALLTLRDIPFPRTHDLEALLHLGGAVEPALGAYVGQARALTPLATEYRYPGDAMEPSSQEALQAHTHAQQIVAFVRGHVEAGLAADNPKELDL